MELSVIHPLDSYSEMMSIEKIVRSIRSPGKQFSFKNN